MFSLGKIVFKKENVALCHSQTFFKTNNIQGEEKKHEGSKKGLGVPKKTWGVNRETGDQKKDAGVEKKKLGVKKEAWGVKKRTSPNFYLSPPFKQNNEDWTSRSHWPFPSRLRLMLRPKCCWAVSERGMLWPLGALASAAMLHVCGFGLRGPRYPGDLVNTWSFLMTTTRGSCNPKKRSPFGQL